MTANNIKIRRAKHDKENPYYMAARATSQDKALSYEALGILHYILSKPDDWEIQPLDLVRTGCKRNRVYRLLNELIQHQYIERIYERNEKGRILSVEYVAHENPLATSPLPTMQEMDMQEVDIPEMEKRHITKDRKEQKTEKTLSPVGDGKKRNAMYDAVLAIWGYTAQLNGLMAGVLNGNARRKGWKEFNLETPVTADEVLAWAEWYRKTELHGKKDMNMLAELVKVQSSITRWQQLGKPTNGNKPATRIIPLDDEPTPYPDTADYVNLAGVSNVG